METYHIVRHCPNCGHQVELDIPKGEAPPVELVCPVCKIDMRDRKTDR